MSERAIRILIADDHPIILEGLRAVVSTRAQMRIVGEAKDGLEVLEIYRTIQPDILLLDLDMPQMDGLTTLTLLLQEFPAAQVIVFSISKSEEIVAQALHAGAQAFLVKAEATMFALLETIEQVASAHPTRRVLEVTAGTTVPLTAREREILQHLANGSSNAEIGKALVISEATVKTHVNNILGKLNVHNRTQAVAIGIKSGLVRLH